MSPMILFAFATLTPAALLALGALHGGIWVLAALGFMTVLTATLDEVVRRVIPDRAESDFPAANTLSAALALTHFAVLGLSVRAMADPALGLWDKLGLLAAAGLFMGQVSNSNAHELIHRGNRVLHDLGKWVYISLLYGHHTSAHVLVHHRQVGTRADPSTARLGESFYRFFWRAWRGSFRKGYQAEKSRLDRVGRSGWHNPYVTYLAGAVLMLGLALALGGVAGLAGYLTLCLYAQAQLMLSDYVQHYGLTRSLTPDGRAEPVGPRHSWNSPHWFSSALMLNAPRHSDHHAHPTRPFPALDLPDGAPMLPRALPVMACVALIPPLWRRVMDPRVAHVTP